MEVCYQSGARVLTGGEVYSQWRLLAMVHPK